MSSLSLSRRPRRPAATAAQVAYDKRMKPFIDGLPSDEAVLIPLYDAYRAASEALLGILNQPRVEIWGAADLIDAEIERADGCACAVATKLSRLKSIKGSQRQNFIETMLSHRLHCGFDESEVLEILAAALALPITEEKQRGVTAGALS